MNNADRPVPGKILLLSYIFLTIGYFFWGTSNIFLKLAQRCADPAVVLAHRFTIAALITTVIMLVKGEFRGLLKHPDFPIVFLCICEPIVYLTESYALQASNATFVGTVEAILPLFAAVFGVLFLKEIPGRMQLLFSILPIIGVIIITLAGSSLGIVRPAAVILMLLYLIFCAAYRTANRFCSARFSPMQRTWVVLVSTAAVSTIMSLIRLNGDLTAYFAPLRNPSFLFPVLYLVIFCSIITNLLVNFAASKVSVLTLSTFGSLNTIFCVLGGVLLLKEIFTLPMFIGTVLVVVGIFLATVCTKKK